MVEENIWSGIVRRTRTQKEKIAGEPNLSVKEGGKKRRTHVRWVWLHWIVSLKSSEIMLLLLIPLFSFFAKQYWLIDPANHLLILWMNISSPPNFLRIEYLIGCMFPSNKSFVFIQEITCPLNYQTSKVIE